MDSARALKQGVFITATILNKHKTTLSMNAVVQYFFKEETLNVMYFLNSLWLFGKNSIP